MGSDINYYIYIFSEHDGGNNEIYYFEVKNGWAMRQITVDGIDYVASNVIHSYDRMVLSDKEFEDKSDLTLISKQAFDEVWNTHLATRQAIWGKVKQTYSVGISVQGFIEIFYPQGVIVNLGDEALGVADYAACKASTKPEFIMGTKYKITAVVQDYDEVNQWIILASPQVHEQRLEQ